MAVDGKRGGTTEMGPAVVQSQGSQKEQLSRPLNETAASALSAVTEVCYLPPQRKSWLESLVGIRCTVNCFMDNQPVKVL